MDVKTLFGENVRYYRREKALSQAELSELLNISIKHLSAIERGLNFVSVDILEKLACALDVPVFYFFVDKRELFYNDVMLNNIDTVIEQKLVDAIEEIKAEIRKK
jgi:transcriptional regulator with XRE-family HTH domain